MVATNTSSAAMPASATTMPRGLMTLLREKCPGLPVKLMSYLPEFDGKQFVDVARGDLDLGSLDSEEDKKAQEEVAKSKEGLIERLKKVLKEIAVYKPSCLLVVEWISRGILII